MSSGTIDLIFICIMGLSVLWGLKEGLLLAAYSIAVWALHLFLVVEYTPNVAAYISQQFPSLQSLSYWAAIIAITVAIMVIGGGIKIMLTVLTWLRGKSGMSRILGGVIGLFRGIVIVLIIMVAVSTRGWAKDPAWQGSTIVNMLKPYQYQVYEAWESHVALINQADSRSSGGSLSNVYE